MLSSEEIREMTPREREETLEDLRTELMHARAQSAMGGAPPDPGAISDLRRTIARMRTIILEEAREAAPAAGPGAAPAGGASGGGREAPEAPARDEEAEAA